MILFLKIMELQETITSEQNQAQVQLWCSWTGQHFCLEADFCIAEIRITESQNP